MKIGIDLMSSVQGILRHLEATYFGTAATPLGELAACLHFPRYMLFFSLDVVPGEELFTAVRDLQAGWQRCTAAPAVLPHIAQIRKKKHSIFLSVTQ